MTAAPEILIVDDDPLVRDTLQFVLRREFEVLTAGSRAEALELLGSRERAPHVALVDLGLPPVPDQPEEGFELVRALVAGAPDMKVVVLSGQADDANARHARTLGAIEFIAKPCEPQRLRKLLREAISMNVADGDGLIGTGPAMERVRRQVELYANAPFPVLIQGESGSGKERIAHALHARGPRSGRPLLALNCAALSSTLVEATLFGHAKGAFTGATGARAGYFEDANDSTLLLDEIGELPLDLQSKLLRVLENGEYQRVGETACRTSRARILAATNRDLKREVREGRFRADLYHRLSVFTIDAPPLRELGEDKLALLEHFMQGCCAQTGLRPFVLDGEARAAWLDYAFPGNVRELRNIVIRLAAKHAGGTVTPAMLRDELDADLACDVTALPGASSRESLVAMARKHLEAANGFVLDDVVGEWERAYVTAALASTDGNLTRAARLLGIQRTTLYSRMQAYATAAARRNEGAA